MGVKLKDIIQPELINFKDLKGKSNPIDAFKYPLSEFFCLQSDKRDGRPL